MIGFSPPAPYLRRFGRAKNSRMHDVPPATASLERRTTKRQFTETTKGAQLAVRLLVARGSRYDSTVHSGKGHSYLITNVTLRMSGPIADSFVARCFRG
jgi:hypothetical protein